MQPTLLYLHYIDLQNTSSKSLKLPPFPLPASEFGLLIHLLNKLLLTNDDTGSLGYPSLRVVYYPSVSTMVTVSRFLAGNREAEL